MSYEYLYPTVLAAIPPGGNVVSIVRHGITRWSVGLRVDVEMGSEETAYFFKIIERREWTPMAKAEYEAQSALAAVIPESVVIPLACGTFEDDSKAFFIT
ncbi:hypothetical protein F5X99DRAFT_221004 [Biscogniauxia marginata]|nr:hypothetical protein F5X99DRAFT_221004 [Biscogniauxia marginata]